MFNGFIDFYNDCEKDGRTRTFLPISLIKRINVFDDGNAWLELDDMTYALSPRLGQQIIDTLCKQGLVLTVDQTNDPNPLEDEPVRKGRYGVRFRKEAE